MPDASMPESKPVPALRVVGSRARKSPYWSIRWACRWDLCTNVIDDDVRRIEVVHTLRQDVWLNIAVV